MLWVHLYIGWLVKGLSLPRLELIRENDLSSGWGNALRGSSEVADPYFFSLAQASNIPVAIPAFNDSELP